ncbi:hypothetical protein [Chitinophaga rhizosphaerae]|uniref:hypothetical protein n=1 Tax=Chitinophaga rhizosphaerae TaxID=1864947 RepID=UPI000F7FF340|nr:hypothetical protein [Chitinophaga rhizosphaerae]
MKRNWITGSLALLLFSCGKGHVKKEKSSSHDHHAHGSMMGHSRQKAAPVQRLTYTVTAGPDTSGVIALAWENIEIQLPVAAQKK